MRIKERVLMKHLEQTWELKSPVSRWETWAQGEKIVAT